MSNPNPRFLAFDLKLDDLAVLLLDERNEILIGGNLLQTPLGHADLEVACLRISHHVLHKRVHVHEVLVADVSVITRVLLGESLENGICDPLEILK